MKRDVDPDFDDVGAAKAARTGVNFTEVREGQWVCEECGNINFADRVTCNRKHCQAARKITGKGNFQVPKDGQWICPSCENINFADRMNCNRRGCHAPRPGTGKGKGMMKGMGMMGAMQPMHAIKGVGKFGGGYAGSQISRGPVINPAIKAGKGNFSELREGQWMCEVCENINFADRETCNRRGCGAPKPRHWGARRGFGTGTSRYPKEAPAPVVNGNFSVPRPDQWVCPVCSNINFADREVCNRSTCQAPRPSEYETAAAAEALQSKVYGAQNVGTGNFQRAREGQWVCSQCQNINFADREFCHRRGCGAPKPSL